MAGLADAAMCKHMAASARPAIVQCAKKTTSMNTSTTILSEVYIEKINNLLIHKKIYRDQSITLDRLAQRLRTNRSYLSATINYCYRKNFSALLNEHRINEACELLKDKALCRKYTMEAIGIEVGFANRMSFYRAFKQIKGVSVGEWANLS